MLKVLLQLQFRQFFSSVVRRQSKNEGVKPRSRGMTVLVLIVLAYCVVVFVGMFAGLFYTLGSLFGGGENDWVYFAALAALVFVMDFIFTIFTAKSQLFEAKDNEALLSLPIRPLDILLSRMLMLLFSDYLFEAIIAIPALAVWISLGFATLPGILCFLVGILFMPCLALTCSCLVGWLLSLLTSRMKNPAIFTTILGVGMFVLYMWGYMKITNGMELTPALAADLTATLSGKLLYPFYCFGRAAADGSVMHLLLYILLMAIPFALLLWVLSRTFLTIATRRKGSPRTAYRATVVKASSQGKALLKNEFRRIVSSSAYMLNGGMGILFMAVIAIGVFFVPVDSLLESGFSGEQLSTIAIGAISYLSLMSLFSASSISLEGQNIYLLQSLPLSGRTVLMAKLSAHLLITAPLVLIASVMCIIALPTSPLLGLLMVVTPQIFNLFIALVGLAMNLALPRFDWADETTVVKQSGAVGFTMLIGMVGGLMTLIPGILVGVLSGSFAVGVVVSTLVPLGCSVGLLVYLKNQGDLLFQKLG